MSRRRARRPQPTTDRRPPEQRLDALVREANPDRAHRMLARIRQDLDATPEPGPWIAAARTLSERLLISEDSFYYLTSLFTDCLVLAASASDPELCRIRAEMDDIEHAHGLGEDEFWYIDEAPADWQQLNDAWNSRADVVVETALRELGHADLAALHEQDPAEFERRSARGRVDLWGEDDASASADGFFGADGFG